MTGRLPCGSQVCGKTSCDPCCPSWMQYERSAIQKWFQSETFSPVSNKPLPHTELVPNLTMTSAIRLLMPSQPAL